MAVLLVTMALARGVAGGGFHAFSCDTINATIGGNVFSAVPFPTLRGPKCPNGAGPTAGDEFMRGANSVDTHELSAVVMSGLCMAALIWLGGVLRSCTCLSCHTVSRFPRVFVETQHSVTQSRCCSKRCHNAVCVYYQLDQYSIQFGDIWPTSPGLHETCCLNSNLPPTTLFIQIRWVRASHRQPLPRRRWMRCRLVEEH